MLQIPVSQAPHQQGENSRGDSVHTHARNVHDRAARGRFAGNRLGPDDATRVGRRLTSKRRRKPARGRGNGYVETMLGRPPFLPAAGGGNQFGRFRMHGGVWKEEDFGCGGWI